MRRIIELTGPSGVGKTTLFRAIQPAIEARGYLGFDRAVTEALRRAPAPRIRVPMASQFLLDRRLTRAAEQRTPPMDRYVELQYSYRKLLNSVLLQDHLAEATVIDDDPISHLFMPELLALATTDPEGLSKALPRRAFVLLKRRPGSILENRMKRLAAQEHRPGFLVPRNREAALRDIEGELETYVRLAEHLSITGAPLLSLDLDEIGPQTARNDLEAFIDTLDRLPGQH